MNYQGTLHIIDACRKHEVPRLVFASSPSTRFHGTDIEGLREDQLTIPEPGHFQQVYAETKMMGERAARSFPNLLPTCCRFLDV